VQGFYSAPTLRTPLSLDKKFQLIQVYIPDPNLKASGFSSGGPAADGMRKEICLAFQ
jgi:hypothetical protein